MSLSTTDAVTLLLLCGEDVGSLKDIKYSLTVGIGQKSEELALLEPLDGNGEQLAAVHVAVIIQELRIVLLLQLILSRKILIRKLCLRIHFGIHQHRAKTESTLAVNTYHNQTFRLFLATILKGESIRFRKNSANQCAYGNAFVGNFSLLAEIFRLKFSLVHDKALRFI